MSILLCLLWAIVNGGSRGLSAGLNCCTAEGKRSRFQLAVTTSTARQPYSGRGRMIDTRADPGPTLTVTTSSESIIPNFPRHILLFHPSCRQPIECRAGRGRRGPSASSFVSPGWASPAGGLRSALLKRTVIGVCHLRRRITSECDHRILSSTTLLLESSVSNVRQILKRINGSQY